jgi:hypothetical protein
MTECRQLLCAKKTGKSTAALKLYGLPPTTEAFEQNIYRGQFQVAHRYSALNQDPPPFNVVDYEWEVDKAKKCRISRNVAEGIPYALEQIMKLVKCGPGLQRPCKGANWVCMGHQLSCTMFCTCGGGCTCLNSFNTKNTDEAVSEDVETGDDQDENVD